MSEERVPRLTQILGIDKDVAKALKGEGVDVGNAASFDEITQFATEKNPTKALLRTESEESEHSEEYVVGQVYKKGPLVFIKGVKKYDPTTKGFDSQPRTRSLDESDVKESFYILE